MAGFMRLQVQERDGGGWEARYSAPGYMDCTDWTPSDVGPMHAAQECFALYGVREVGSDDRKELAEMLWMMRKQGFRK